MKKRLLALLTSAICACGFVGSLSVSAVDPDFNETEFYIVSFTNEDPESDSYRTYNYSESINADWYGQYHYTTLDQDSIPITGEKTSGFSYGDILLIDGFASVQMSYPPTCYMGADSAKYVGNCRDVLETKELTLTKKEIKPFGGEEETFDCIEHIKFNFTDENGKEYYYICYYYNGDPEVDVNICNVGDKILASVYKDAVILPLELYPDTTENLPGDIDGNGVVDIIDVVQMNRVYVGCQTFTPEQQKIGDINQNGRIDLSDSMQALRYIVGLVDSLEA